MNLFKISLLTILLTSSFSFGQGVWKLFKNGETKAIRSIIKNSSSTKAYVYENLLDLHFDQRRPLNKLGCVPDSIDYLSLSIYFGNKKITKQLLKDSKFSKNPEILSQALNVAVYKNDPDLFEKLMDLGAKLNVESTLLDGRNTIQIAIARRTDQKLLSLIIDKTLDEAYKNVDCYGNTTLHILVEKNDFYLFKKLDSKCIAFLYTKNEKEELPIEVALRNGNVSIAKSLFSMMSQERSYQAFASDKNILRLNFHAYQSGNALVRIFTDSIIAKRFNIDENYVYRALLNNDSYDLNTYINQADYFSEYYNKLDMLSPQVKESNFNEFLKNFRPVFKELTGLDLNTNVKINPFSKMINFDDLFYLSKFYVAEQWFTKSKKSADGTPIIEEKTDPFYAMLAFNLPDRFQSNYSVDFGELSGLRSDNFEKIKAALEILPVQFLKVTNVADHNFNYEQFFPNLRVLDLEVDEQSAEAFYIGRVLSSVKTIRVIGVKTLQFEANMDRGNLTQVVISQNTKILRLPAGIEIIRE